MDKGKQRIAIATACGWIRAYEEGKDEGTGKWFWHCGNKNTKQPPDYLNDLNAMHEAEKVLFGTQKDERGVIRRMCYSVELQRLACGADNPDESGAYYATAAQRAEAFLRTLNLWEE